MHLPTTGVGIEQCGTTHQCSARPRVGCRCVINVIQPLSCMVQARFPLLLLVPALDERYCIGFTPVLLLWMGGYCQVRLIAPPDGRWGVSSALAVLQPVSVLV